jgi:hypothetical protein
MGQKAELRIAVAPNDMGTVVQFFERTAYEVGEFASGALALTAPSDMDERLARREVEIYVGVLERLHPEVDISIY